MSIKQASLVVTGLLGLIACAAPRIATLGASTAGPSAGSGVSITQTTSDAEKSNPPSDVSTGPTPGSARRTTPTPTTDGPTRLSPISTPDMRAYPPPKLVPLTRAYTYPRADILLEPPGAEQPRVAWSTAYATCLTGDSLCGRDLSPTITLALVTDNHTGTIGPDNQLVPSLQRTLVWVVTFTGSVCAPAGEVHRTSTAATSPTIFECTAVNFVSADTGQTLYSIQGPNL